MSEMRSRSVLRFLILSRLARVAMEMYWSLSIWDLRYRSLPRCSLWTDSLVRRILYWRMFGEVTKGYVKLNMQNMGIVLISLKDRANGLFTYIGGERHNSAQRYFYCFIRALAVQFKFCFYASTTCCIVHNHSQWSSKYLMTWLLPEKEYKWCVVSYDLVRQDSKAVLSSSLISSETKGSHNHIWVHIHCFKKKNCGFTVFK